MTVQVWDSESKQQGRPGGGEVEEGPDSGPIRDLGS